MKEDMILKAKKAKSVTELMELAKSENLLLTEETAEKFFTGLHAQGELSDNELDAVAGGGCSNAAPKYKEGDIVALKINGGRCPNIDLYYTCTGTLFRIINVLEFGRGYEIECTTCYRLQLVTDSDILGCIK